MRNLLQGWRDYKEGENSYVTNWAKWWVCYISLENQQDSKTSSFSFFFVWQEAVQESIQLIKDLKPPFINNKSSIFIKKVGLYSCLAQEVGTGYGPKLVQYDQSCGSSVSTKPRIAFAVVSNFISKVLSRNGI